MGKHTKFLRMKMKGKHQVVMRQGTLQVERLKKGKYLPKAQPWICPKCKYKNNQSSFNCHNKKCSYRRGSP